MLFPNTMPAIAKPAGGTVFLDKEVGKDAKTILVVDDEEMVRKLVVEILRAADYQVLEANGGNKALEVFKKQDRPIHLLLTDVVMPPMDGPELAKLITRGRTDTHVLYMSGYPSETLANEGLFEEGTSHIQKPFAMDALLHKVSEILEERL